MSFGDFVRKYGLTFQAHKVTTPDGYILEVQNIRHPTLYNPKAPVVFMQHGLFCNSEFWMRAKTNSILHRLASAGHDIWLGNNRGNSYSMKHTTFDPVADEMAFWDFSYYDFGKYDAPTQIDFALRQTGKLKLTYIGHSQGTS